VLLAITKDDYTLEPSLAWETLGMRGTCSAGFELKFKGSSDQIFPRPMTDPRPDHDARRPSVLVFGLGRDRRGGGRPRAGLHPQGRPRRGWPDAPGAAHFTAAKMTLAKLRAIITANLDHYIAHEFDERALGLARLSSPRSTCEGGSIRLAVETVMSAMRACGLSGYQQRRRLQRRPHLRDVLSAPIMINQRPHPLNIATAS